MKVLIVEDELSKKENIINLLCEKFNDIQLVTAMSVRSAKAELKKDLEFDCIILDMSLPTFDIGKEEFGGRPQGFGGKEVIRQVIREKKNIPILVVTAYEAFSNPNSTDENNKDITLDELTLQLETYSSSLKIEVIKYNTLMDDWKAKVLSFMEEISK
ncbi:response regulator [Acinetobacter soli]|uniref:response regulator n=1 Tax=Acinetobacter soli TaxID=487316 RepID=UPI00124FE9CA|nr:response regulator [Acinetobacter soli]